MTVIRNNWHMVFNSDPPVLVILYYYDLQIPTSVISVNLRESLSQVDWSVLALHSVLYQKITSRSIMNTHFSLLCGWNMYLYHLLIFNYRYSYCLLTACGLTVVGREQSNLTYNSTNYQWRKEAKQPDTQQCKLPVKEGSTATWLTTVQINSEGREHSNLTHNIAHCDTDRC